MGKISSEQLRKVERIKPFGHSRAPKKILGKLTQMSQTPSKYHPSVTQIWREAGWEGERSSELGWCSLLRTSPSCTWSIIMNLMLQSWYLLGVLGPAVPEFFSWQRIFFSRKERVIIRYLFHFYVIFQKTTPLLRISKCREIRVFLA